MLSPADQLADQVAAAMLAQSFSLPFTAEAAELPDAKADYFSELRVHVIPRTQAIELEGRKPHESVAIDIGIRRRCPDWKTGGARPLKFLAWELLQFWNPAKPASRIQLAAGPYCRNVSAKNEPACDPASLREQNLFVSLITLNFLLLEN